MTLTIIFDYLIISIIASIAINTILRNFARNNNFLIDIPDRSRKFHKNATPVTGGLGIIVALLISGKIYFDLNNLNDYVPDFTYQLTICSIALVFFFLIDDIKELKTSGRIFAQILLSAYMIYETGVSIETLGNLFAFGEIKLGFMGIPFTIFCVVGVMNAFNMIDGINGLCAGCGMLALLLVGFSSGLIYDSTLILIIGSMIGFLLFNLSIFGEKRGVFLGDHGSNMIGFWLAWSCIYASQNQMYDIEPMTMIWFVAIPLLDCIGLLFSRISKGLSWSTPGRDHIHHKLMNKFSQEQTLLIILIISLLLGVFGIYLEKVFSIWISTMLFVMFTGFYFVFSYYSNFETSGNDKNV